MFFHGMMRWKEMDRYIYNYLRYVLMNIWDKNRYPTSFGGNWMGWMMGRTPLSRPKMREEVVVDLFFFKFVLLLSLDTTHLFVKKMPLFKYMAKLHLCALSHKYIIVLSSW